MKSHLEQTPQTVCTGPRDPKGGFWGGGAPWVFKGDCGWGGGFQTMLWSPGGAAAPPSDLRLLSPCSEIASKLARGRLVSMLQDKIHK